MADKPKTPLDVYEFATTVQSLFREIENRFDRIVYVKAGPSHRYVTGVYVDDDGDLIVEAF